MAGVLRFPAPSPIAFLMSVIFAAQMLLPAAGIAAPPSSPPTHTTQASTKTTTPFTPTGPINLNLSSTTASIAAGNLAITKTLSINVGGSRLAVTSSTALTPAELVAAMQVATTGIQTLNLGAQGNAISGRFSLSSGLAQSLTGLVIPQQVKLFDNLAVSGNLNLSGNLTNGGTFIAFTTSPTIQNATISAANIYNLVGATITSALSGMSGATKSLSLNLAALGNIVNNGTIASSGALSVTAGGTITNALPAGMAVGAQHAVPAMLAANDLSMQAPTIFNQGNLVSQTGNLNVATANLTNSGLMQTLAGNINVQSLGGNVLNVNNTGGSILAANQLTLQTSSGILDSSGAVVSEAVLTETGGTLSGSSVNFTSPYGRVTVEAGQINGPVNVVAGAAAVGAAGGTLDIASSQVIGDPIYSNTNGDLDLSGDVGGLVQSFTNGGLFGGSDFIALASGNICDGCVAGLPQQSGALTETVGSPNGGQILIEAGVNFTVNNANCSTCVAGVDYTINSTPQSTTGGSVNLPNNSFLTNNNNITVVAYTVNPGTGNITINSLNAYGSSSNVTVTAGGQVQLGSLSSHAGNTFSVTSGGNLTNLGSIDAPTVSLQTTNNGTINLRANVSATSSMTISANGTGNINQTVGVLTTPNLTLSGATIGSSTAPIAIAAGTLAATATGSAYIANQSVSPIQLAASSAGNINAFQLTSEGDIFVTGTVQASGIFLTTTGAQSFLDIGANLTGGFSVTLSAPTVVNTGAMSGSNSISISSSSSSLLVSGSGTMTAPTIDLTSPNSLIVSQNKMSGSVTPTAPDNLLLHVDNTSGFTLGTVTACGGCTQNFVSPDGFGGLTVWYANTSQTFDSGGVIAMSTGSVAPSISSTASSHSLTSALTVTGNSSGSLAVFVRDTDNGVNTSVTNTGSIMLSNSYSALSLQSINSSGNSVNVAAGGTLSTTGTSTISGSDITLRTVSGSGSISIGNGVTSTGSLTLSTTGTGNISESAGTLQASNAVFLESYLGAIGSTGSSTNVLVSAPVVNALAPFGGDVNVYSSYTSPLQLGTSAAGTSNNFTFTANGNVTTTGTISSGNGITLDIGNNGALALGADVVAGGTLAITMTGSGSISQTAGTLYGSQVNLTSASGSIGSSNASITVNAAQLSVQVNGGTGAYISNVSNLPIQMNASNVGSSGALQLTSAGEIDVNGLVQGNDISLTTTNFIGNIILAADITANNSVTLAPGNVGNLSQLGCSSCVVTAPTVNLLADVGNIGDVDNTGNITQNLVVDTSNLTANNQVFGGTGGFRGVPGNTGPARLIIFVQNVGTGLLKLNGFNGTIGMEFSLISSGPVEVTSGSSVNGVFYFPQAPFDPSIYMQAPSITVDSGAFVGTNTNGGVGAVQLTTDSVTNNGRIQGDSVNITALNSATDNLTVNGTGTISIDTFANTGDEGYFRLQTTGAVSVTQGAIHGLITNGGYSYPTFSSGFITIPSYTASSLSLTVGSGELQLAHLATTGVVSITNNGGDILVEGNNQVNGVISGTNITVSVNGTSNGVASGVINLEGGSAINASGNLTLNTPVLNNNSATLLYDQGNGTFDEGYVNQFAVNTSLTLSITNQYGTSEYNGTYQLLYGLPGVHGGTSITVQNPVAGGDLLVSGVGGMWTGTTSSGFSSGNYSSVGTGTITLNATGGSIVASQTLMMGNVTLNANTHANSQTNSGLALLNIGITGTYTFATDPNFTNDFNNNTASYTDPAGHSQSLTPSQAMVTPNSCLCSPYGTWHPNTSTNAQGTITLNAGGPLTNSFQYSFPASGLTGTTFYNAPFSEIVGGLLILDSMSGGSPSVVVNGTPSGNMTISTQGPPGSNGFPTHPSNTLVLATALPLTFDGNLTVSNSGNVYLDSGSFGAFNIGNVTQRDIDNNPIGGVQGSLTINAQGNVAFNGTGASLYNSSGTIDGFVHEVYVPLGTITINLSGNPFVGTTSFYNNGAQVYTDQFNLNVDSTGGAGRIVPGIVNTIGDTFGNGNITITDNSISTVNGTNDVTIGFLNAYNGVSIVNKYGNIYMTAETIQVNSNGNFNGTSGTVTIEADGLGNTSVTNPGGNITIESNSNITPFTGTTVDITYNGNLTIENIANINTDSGNSVTNYTDLNTQHSSLHQTYFGATFNNGALNVNITTSGNAQVGGSADNSAGTLNITNNGNLTLNGAEGNVVNITNTNGNLTFSTNSFMETGTSAVITNTNGNMLFSNSTLFIAGSFSGGGPQGNTGSIAISNSGGTLTINNNASINAAGSLSVSNSGGVINIQTPGMNASGQNGSPNFGFGSQGKVLATNGNLSITNDQNINITGPGSDTISAGTGMTIISTAGSVNVSQFQLSSSVSGQSQNSFSLAATGAGLTVGTIYANPSGTGSSGAINLSAATDTLQVLDNSTVSANLGNLLVQNVTGGFISLGQNTLLVSTASGTTNGNVTIVSGAVPLTPVAGTPPSNVNFGTVNGGQIYWGAQGLTGLVGGNPSDNDYVTTSAGRVVFSASDVSLITMNGNSVVNGKVAGNIPAPLITSLDLVNDPAAATLLQTLRQEGVVGGNFTYSGGMSSGTALIPASEFALALTAEDIPSTVQVTMEDFQSTKPFTIILTASSIESNRTCTYT